MADEDRTGTRPHFYIDNAVHGAVKDVGAAFGLSQQQSYELAIHTFVALGPPTAVDPRPEDEDLADAFDKILDQCDLEDGPETD